MNGLPKSQTCFGRSSCFGPGCRKRKVAIAIQWPERKGSPLTFCSMRHAAVYFIHQAWGDLETESIVKQLESMPEYGDEVRQARLAKTRIIPNE